MSCQLYCKDTSQSPSLLLFCRSCRRGLCPQHMAREISMGRSAQKSRNSRMGPRTPQSLTMMSMDRRYLQYTPPYRVLLLYNSTCTLHMAMSLVTLTCSAGEGWHSDRLCAPNTDCRCAEPGLVDTCGWHQPPLGVPQGNVHAPAAIHKSVDFKTLRFAWRGRAARSVSACKYIFLYGPPPPNMGCEALPIFMLYGTRKI